RATLRWFDEQSKVARTNSESRACAFSRFVRTPSRWTDEQSTVARTNLEKAQARLSEVLQKHGIVTKEENLDAETAALTALTAQLTEVRSKTFDSQSKQRADDTLPDVMQSSVASGLRSDI